MTDFIISGRCLAAPPPADWSAHLVRMLGSKPRRIGTWAELGLYGALRCMEDAGESQLPPDAQIWQGSRRGTYAATDTVIDQLREDLPMPLAFLQTQPSQVLAMLSARLGWKGHACFLSGGDMQDLLRLASAQATQGGLLLGVVDEMDGGAINWLRLQREDSTLDGFVPATTVQIFADRVSHLRVTPTGIQIR